MQSTQPPLRKDRTARKHETKQATDCKEGDGKKRWVDECLEVVIVGSVLNSMD